MSISTISMAPIVPEAHGEGKVSAGRVVAELPRRLRCLERSLQGQAQVLTFAQGHTSHIGELYSHRASYGVKCLRESLVVLLHEAWRFDTTGSVADCRALAISSASDLTWIPQEIAREPL